MSFSEEIRATGNFQRQFQKEKRRIQLSEVPKTDIETLQTHVVDVRTQIHFTDAINNEAMYKIPIGPYQYILEPDYKSVKLRTKFKDVHGIGEYDSQSHTVGGNFTIYNALRMYDQAGVSGQKLWYYILSESPDPPNTEHFFDHLWKWDVDVYPTIPAYLNFDGVNDYVDLGAQTDLWSRSITKFSVSMWVNPSSLSSLYRTFFGVAEESDASISIYFTNDGPFGGYVIGCDVTSDDYASNFAIRYSTNLNQTIGQWYHVTMTYSQSGTSDAVLKLYVNGVLQSNGEDVNNSMNEPLDIAASTKGVLALFKVSQITDAFHGKIRDFRWWNDKELTSGEVTDVYRDNSTAPTPNYWLKTNEGKEDPVDSITGTRIGVLTNGTYWTDKRLPLGVCNSLGFNLSDGDATHFMRVEASMSTHYDFNDTNFSVGFWIKPTAVTGGTSDLVAMRYLNSSNNWKIMLDSAVDSKLWVDMEDGGVHTKRQFDRPLVVGQWYFVVLTWDAEGSVLRMRVNDEPDIASSKGTVTMTSIDGLFFGGFPDVGTNEIFLGDFTGLTYYRHPASIIFDGNDNVNCGNHASLWSQGLTRFTFSYWVYPIGDWATTRDHIRHGASGANRFRVETNAGVTGENRWRIRNAADTTDFEAKISNMTLNEWQLITCTYDSNLASANIKMYRNGVLGGTTGNLTETINLSADMLLGGELVGWMQGFQWWTTKCLSEKDVSDLYNLKYTGPKPDYWLPMDDGDIAANSARTQDIRDIQKNKYATFSGCSWDDGKGRILSDPEKTNLYNYNTITPITKPLVYGDGQYGYLNASIVFDGTGDTIDCGDHTDLWSQSLNKLSFSFWFYPSTSTSATVRNLVRHGSGVTGCFFCHTFNNDLAFKMNFGAGDVQVFGNFGKIHTWHFATCVYDSTLGSNEMKLYLDGALLAQGQTGGSVNLTATVLQLGGDAGGGGHIGYIQDFKWWNNVALTESEIVSLYRGESDFEEMDYWLPLNEGTGNPVDKKGGKVAILQNNAAWSTNHH